MGGFVGRYNKFFKKMENNKTFKLHTVYCVYRKTNPCVIVFYDKQKESCCNKHIFTQNQSRNSTFFFEMINIM